MFPKPCLISGVISLDMGLLVIRHLGSGETLKNASPQLVSEVRQDPDVILVIDEIHTLVGAGSLEGGMDAA